MTKSFKENGHETFDFDIEKKYNPDLAIDILDLSIDGHLPWKPNVCWFSVPCQKFSVASISSSWKGGKEAYIPKNKDTEYALALLDRTIEIIAELKPRIWFIENPRGVMRKIIGKIFKKYKIEHWYTNTTCYCQWGDKRMKPTDIFSNMNIDLPMCRNNNQECRHEKAPRGSKTGTQGLKNDYERSKIPKSLCYYIVHRCEVELL